MNKNQTFTFLYESGGAYHRHEVQATSTETARVKVESQIEAGKISTDVLVFCLGILYLFQIAS